jgi:hypothetical protein
MLRAPGLVPYMTVEVELSSVIHVMVAVLTSVAVAVIEEITGGVMSGG